VRLEAILAPENHAIGRNPFGKGLREVDGLAALLEKLNPGAVFDLVFAGQALPERQPARTERARRSRPG
jgi:hypothetical protein